MSYAQPAIDAKYWGHGQFGQFGDRRFGGAHEVPVPEFVVSEFDYLFGATQAGGFD